MACRLFEQAPRGLEPEQLHGLDRRAASRGAVAEAAYFGVLLDDRSLTTGEGARLGAIGLEAWMAAR